MTCHTAADQPAAPAKKATALFSLGQTVATPGALEALDASDQAPLTFLRRHVLGDWGEVCKEDGRANDRALRSGGRLFSAYRTTLGARLWVITEADRSSTCILLPEEY
jgi:hypothetical protein